MKKLSEEERDEVLKLAAILRIADGLDYGHRGAVKGVTANIGDEAVLHLDADQAGPETAAALRKADLFEHVYGLKVVVL